MRQRQVDPRRIMVPDTRVTSVFDSETLEMLRRSMAEAGIISPIICIEENSQLVLVDGFHRLVEAMDSRLDRIPVAIIEGGMTEALLFNLSLNIIRGQTHPGDVLKVLRVLHQEENLGTDEISRRTGLSLRYIEDLLIIGRARPEVMEALDKGDIGKGHALLLAGIDDEGVQLRELALCVQYRWTIATLKEQIKNVAEEIQRRLEAPPPPPPPTKQMLECEFCGQSWPLEQLRNPTTCPACAGIMHQSIILARLEAERSAAPALPSPAPSP